jgi:hypothetical protein
MTPQVQGFKADSQTWKWLKHVPTISNSSTPKPTTRKQKKLGSKDVLVLLGPLGPFQILVPFQAATSPPCVQAPVGSSGLFGAPVPPAQAAVAPLQVNQRDRAH